MWAKRIGLLNSLGMRAGAHRLLLPYVVKFLLDREGIHCREWKREYQGDAFRERRERLLVRPFDLFRCTVHRSRIWNTECAVSGCPGPSGQTSCAALSQTVKTKLR